MVEACSTLRSTRALLASSYGSCRPGRATWDPRGWFVCGWPDIISVAQIKAEHFNSTAMNPHRPHNSQIGSSRDP